MSIRSAILAAFAIMLGCSSSGPAGPRWWCSGEGLCFLSEEVCIKRMEQIGATPECRPRARAFCRHGCSDDAAGGVVCAENCVASEEVCEAGLGRDREEPCVSKAPPTLPTKLSPFYARPGFWCWEGIDAAGQTVSGCDKYEEECEAQRRELGLPERCVAREQGVVCFFYDVAERFATDALCFTGQDDCERQRPRVMERGGLIGAEAFTECAPWPYR